MNRLGAKKKINIKAFFIRVERKKMAMIDLSAKKNVKTANKNVVIAMNIFQTVFMISMLKIAETTSHSKRL